MKISGGVKRLALAGAIVAVCVGVSVGVAESASTTSGSSSPAAASSSPDQTLPALPPPPADTEPAPAGSPVADADAAIAITGKNAADFGDSTVVGAVLTTPAALVDAKILDAVPLSTTPDAQVWAVTYSGSFTPQGPDGTRYPWGTEVIDAASGNALAVLTTGADIPPLLTASK